MSMNLQMIVGRIIERALRDLRLERKLLGKQECSYNTLALPHEAVSSFLSRKKQADSSL